MTMTACALTGNTDQVQEVYRLKKCFAVVHFDQAANGRIVVLPEGAELRLVGSSQLSGCLEVQHKHERYNMFETDLLGPWSHRIEQGPRKSRRIQPGRTATAVGACA